MNALIFDTHAHYDDQRFDGFAEKLISSLTDNGVAAAITMAVDEKSSANAVKMAEKYPHIYAAVGIHPQEISADTRFNPEFFEPLIKNKRVVAIGEIGLDYYWSTEYVDNQKRLFAQQLIFANEHNLPVSVHDREAHADTLEILKKYRPSGVVHCFSGSAEMAKELVKLGMYIGVGGVVTFKNSKTAKHVVESLPIEKILLETDAPYLSPEPLRGTVNNSANIKYIAECVAEIKGIAVEEVLNITFKNAQSLFAKI